jgi:hypothetical protein
MKLTAGTLINCPPESVRLYTQRPDLHARWDLRFTHIDYAVGETDSAVQRFRYGTRICAALVIEGWGETSRTPTGTILRFGSDDPKSLIREGTGCWVYRSRDQQIEFSTVYDYEVRFGCLGVLADRILFRPLMVWATRWSFDRLRLWLEHGLTPETTWQLWVVKTVARSRSEPCGHSKV